MDRRAESDALHQRVRRFIMERQESFDALACDIARFQARFVEPVGRLMRARGVSGEQLSKAADIPALPSDAFRHRRVAAHPEREDARCFATSGTTASARGRHPMRTVETYAAGALAWGEAMLFPDVEGLGFVGLVARKTAAPHSSLTFMLARFAEQLGGPASWLFDGERLDVDGVVRACSEARQPLLVAGTSFAFVHLEDALGGRRLPLPAGSRVMHTGGFKGRSRSVEPARLRAAIAERFALAPSHVVGEYGMTELSSQLYQGSLVGQGDGYRPPPWLSVEAVDPVTLEPVARGAVGIARFVDLANVDSALAVQTADRIRVLPDGSVELLGRLPGAPPRGCSLALEHLLR